MKIKKHFIVCIALMALAVAGAVYFFPAKREANNNQNTSSVCQIEKMTFYYLETCEWCNKVKAEGTLEKIEGLGVKINKINAAVGPVRHKFQSVPTFVINGKVYEGYKTFEEIKELLDCSVEKDYKAENQAPTSLFVVQNEIEKDFFGQKGEKVVLENKEIRLEAAQFNDNKARFYNVVLASGKTVYFFVVRDKDGKYRAAANACQVCFQQKKGFRQEGNEMVCNNCGNRYPMEKIATEKGGCNPAPISPNLELKDGKIIVKQSELEGVAGLF